MRPTIRILAIAWTLLAGLAVIFPFFVPQTGSPDTQVDARARAGAAACCSLGMSPIVGGIWLAGMVALLVVYLMSRPDTPPTTP